MTTGEVPAAVNSEIAVLLEVWDEALEQGASPEAFELFAMLLGAVMFPGWCG